MHNTKWSDTIIAPITSTHGHAVAVIRISGSQSFEFVEQLFTKSNKNFASHTVHYGFLKNGETIIDEVLVSFFKGPQSYTGEDVVEIACHGSQYIVMSILNVFINLGCRMAKAGEFTQRAFLNNKMDLTQAEAVADLIASENEKQHKIAMRQLRGGFADKLKELRAELINFTALIELELDFSEEDVTFANRSELFNNINFLLSELELLAQSFKLGNAIKKGIPVAIIGKPNVGKSTLLNFLLNEEKAIVSDIAGTTRDIIEDTLTIDGVQYRFIDTAGIRNTDDVVENLGIERTLQKTKEADIILLVVDAKDKLEDIVNQYQELNINHNQELIFIVNKIDELGVCNGYDMEEALITKTQKKALAVSVKSKLHTEKIFELLKQSTHIQNLNTNQLIISNARHLDEINKTIDTLKEVKKGMENNLSGEFLSIDIRRALKSLGNITGDIELDRDILGAIFGKFCIGK